MWDEEDIFARWLNLVCGLGAGGLAVLFGYLSYQWFYSYSYSGRRGGWAAGLCLAMVYVAGRCLWYAATGKNDVNRDDF